MLLSKPDPIRVALNRVTFGARDRDVANVNAIGWPAWVTQQLAAMDNTDAALGAHFAAQTMPIKYAAPAVTDMRGTWLATDEMRPLNYLFAPTKDLWYITRNNGGAVSGYESVRISQELAAATWISNAHGRDQLREFMTDFWHNHFNIGKKESALATAVLPVFDRGVIRPNVFGNFRTLLGATAKSSSMLIYLDNWVSGATRPNENYAREIMELHTLGGEAYLGTVDASAVALLNGVAVGFTDQDIVQAARVLSGWTILYGQRDQNNVVLPNTGEFTFNLQQHNLTAGKVLGVSMGNLANGMAQGEKFLDIIATHPSTANFIVTKLVKRIFGDSPPQAVINRAILAWNMNQSSPDQIAKVLRAILLDGEEIKTAPVTKVRRPYERVIALARTTDMVVNAATFMDTLLDPFSDGLFAWQAPNGRPDVDRAWLSTGMTLDTWNVLFKIPNFAEFSSAPLRNQSPTNMLSTANGIVEYWVGRMVGYQLNQSAMNSLIIDQAGANGIPAAVRTNNTTTIDNAHRRLVSLIATSEEFTLR
jgi:uncharacterized protein (DUF1800 family)